MDTHPSYTTPLSPPVLYILLALARENDYGYGIASGAANASLGSLRLPAGTLYPLLKRLAKAGLIEELGMDQGLRSEVHRKHYGITEAGLLLLKEDLKRMRHAVRIGKAAGLFQDELPPELQRLLAQLDT